MPEGEPIGEKKNPLQYKVHQEARQVETLVKVDAHTSWQNSWVFNIGVMSYYRRPAYVLNETLLKNAPLVAYAPTEPRLLYTLQILRPLLGSSVDLWQSLERKGVPVAGADPAYCPFCLESGPITFWSIGRSGPGTSI